MVVTLGSTRIGLDVRARTSLQVAALLLALIVMAAAPAFAADPCCSITHVDARSGVVTAQETASGRTFQFAAPNAAVLGTLKVGQRIFANFAGGQVSLDGRTACCKIVVVGPAAPVARPAAPVQAPTPAPAQPATPGAARGASAAAAARLGGVQGISMALPTLTFGAPIPATRGQAGPGVARRPTLGTHMVSLRGIDDIKKAPINEDARNMLLMHALQVPPTELDHYIVDPQLAEQWMKAHPAPASAKPPSGGHGGCHAISMHCAGESVKHAEEEASRQSEKLLKEAQDDWRHVAGEAAKDWNASEECFADHTLRPQDVPVKFTLPIQIPLSFEKDGKSDNKYGGVSGKVKGTVTVGLPLTADFMAHVQMFYIPCLPFAFRPKNLGADGNLTVAATLGATVNATGQFQEFFMIPTPPADPHIPIEVIPIVIAGVPVAEMDVSIHFDGSLAVDGEGAFDGQFKLNAPHTMAFDFDCDGHGCSGNAHNVPVPVTTTESVQVTGRIHVKPAIYTALQLDFDGNVLTARAGPQPYLWGELYGCGAASATQSSAAPTTTQTQYALTADLDWGIELRAEALAAGKKLGGFTTDLFKLAHDCVQNAQGHCVRHIWFKDLVGSTGLAPDLEGVAQVGVGRPAAYTVKMRQCYPYTDAVEYALRWTGGASDARKAAPRAPVANASIRGGAGIPDLSSLQCTLQTGQGDCWGDPAKLTSFDLAWPAAGNFTLQAAPVRDKHGREFGALPQQQTQVQVTVQP